MMTTIIWQNISNQGYAQTPQISRCIYKTQNQFNISLNSTKQNNVIILGKIPSNPYVVVIPSDSETLLNTVKSYITDAFLAKHQLGTYIHAGGFTNPQDAQCVSKFLKSYNLDARVVYFH
jgi:hypothetical protein